MTFKNCGIFIMMAIAVTSSRKKSHKTLPIPGMDLPLPWQRISHKIIRRAPNQCLTVMDEYEGNYEVEIKQSKLCDAFNWFGFVPPEHRPLVYGRLNQTDAAALRFLEQRAWAVDRMDIKMNDTSLAKLLGVSVWSANRTIKKLALLGFIGICNRHLKPVSEHKSWATVRFLRIHSIGWFHQWTFSGEHSANFKNDVRPDHKEITSGDGMFAHLPGKIHPRYLVTEPMVLPDPDAGGCQKLIEPAISRNPLIKFRQMLEWVGKGWIDIAAKEEAGKLIGDAAYGDERARQIVGWQDDFKDNKKGRYAVPN